MLAEYVEKCFLLRENLIISILKMATGKELDDLTEEDAKKMTIVSFVGDDKNQTVKYNGEISCAYSVA